MSRLVRVKNIGATDSWEGQTIPIGTYYTLEESEFERWSANDKVYTDVSSGTLVVNNGADNVDDFTDHLAGWKWLRGDMTPPQSGDGDWHVLNENFAHVTGNLGINWTIERELENEEVYSENFIVPAGRHATINLFRGGSDRVSSSLLLEWFEEVTVDNFMRINPWVRADESISAVVNGNHTTGDTVLTLFNTNNEVDEILLNHYYCMKVGGIGCHVKVISKDPGNDQITIESGLPYDVDNGTNVALTDRPIGRIGNQIASDSLVWVSPPNGFIGNGKNYFKITIKNEDIENVALVSASLNGWHTPTTGGD